ncbi:MAG: hypothetical protein RR382_07680 [Tannerellaceae bacterium]
MIKKNGWIIGCFLALLCSLASCDVIEDNDWDRRNAEVLLCGMVWMDDYITSDNIDCHQELYFNMDGTGMDVQEFFYKNHSEVTKFPFRWRWDGRYGNNMLMAYPDGDSYFTNIFINEYSLSGVLDGVDVVFKVK